MSFQPSSDDLIHIVVQEIVKRSKQLVRHREAKNLNTDQQVFERVKLFKVTLPEDINEIIASFIVRAVIINPVYRFNIETQFTREEVERLIQVCVELLSRENSPLLETLRMQLVFDSSLPLQGDYLKKDKSAKATQLAPILREIMDFQSKKANSIEDLYRKVVMYVILKSELGDPMDLNVVKETTAALESTFPTSEVNLFMGLPRTEKESQLLGLTQLVTGIRLFNKDLGKGGESIPDIPNHAQDLIKNISNTINTFVAESTEKIQQLSSFAKLVASVKFTDISEEMTTRAKQGLMFSVQAHNYLGVLKESNASSESILRSNGERMAESLRELIQICKSKTAVPVDHVYPLFMLLSTCWNTYRDESFLLEFRMELLERMVRCSKKFAVVIPEKILASGELQREPFIPPLKSDVEIIAQSADLMSTIGLYTRKIEILHPGNSSIFSRLVCEYNGFCPITLLKENGLLVPGNRSLGILRYKDQLYSFSTIEAATEFSKDPDHVIRGVLDVACKFPQLVHILYLHRYFPTISALENVRSFAKQKLIGKVSITCDASLQTDTHIVDTFIDPTYEWNEWEMRRKALMLVDLRHKRTHGSQTDRSQFRRENFTQHYLPKNQVTQTKTDSCVNAPQKKIYLHGLRHDRTRLSELRVVDLTFDVTSTRNRK